MSAHTYEHMLSGGHHNSLGRTEEVVADVLKHKARLQNLYDCYKSQDAVVRLRVSSAMKRVCKSKPEWVMEYLDRLQSEVSQLDQPSAKWTLAQLFVLLDRRMSQPQRSRAVEIMQHNLQTESDWIVQNTTAEALAHFAEQDEQLKHWLLPQLQKQLKDKHASVARRAQRLLDQLQKKSL